MEANQQQVVVYWCRVVPKLSSARGLCWTWGGIRFDLLRHPRQGNQHFSDSLFPSAAVILSSPPCLENPSPRIVRHLLGIESQTWARHHCTHLAHVACRAAIARICKVHPGCRGHASSARQCVQYMAGALGPLRRMQVALLAGPSVCQSACPLLFPVVVVAVSSLARSRTMSVLHKLMQKLSEFGLAELDCGNENQ